MMGKFGVLSLALVCAHLAYGDIHTLKYFYTASAEVPNFPEFVVVAMVDDVQFVHYDSNTKKAVPKQDWIKQNEDSQYWETEAGNFLGASQSFKANIDICKSRFNQTGGMHTVQYLYGCEWDDETDQRNGFRQHGYDGEDWLAYDMKTFRWIAPVQQAEATQRKWNNDQAQLEFYKNYITQQCVEWLQKYVTYAKAAFQSKVSRPVGSLLQKSSSGVACHATGFYPDSVMITWKKNGVEMDDDVNVGETLPNEDGTFQKRAVLTVSPEERKNAQYSCEVTHKSGAPIVMVFKEDNLPAIIGGCLGGAAVVIMAVVVAVVLMKKKDYRKAPQTESDNGSESSAEPPKA